MLCFGNHNDVGKYIEYIDHLMDNWDYSNSDIWDDTNQGVNHLGDESRCNFTK